jgi:hypothetical protein
MTAKRIPALTVLTGAQSATDDKLVIFDVTANETKAITRQELAAGLVGDLPYVASGGISATTVPTAIAELDAEAARLAQAQTFSAQQTVSGGLVIQTRAATAIADITNAVNTTSKVAGKIVYDTTNNRIMVASGALAASPWYIADGSASVAPA